MQKNELTIFKNEKIELLETISTCIQKKRKNDDEISLYDLFMFHRNVKQNIKNKIDLLWQEIEKTFCQRLDLVFGSPTYNEMENTLTIRLLEQRFKHYEIKYLLTYKKIEGEIYLVDGPKHFIHCAYEANTILITELYSSFEKLFHLYELRKKYTDEFVIIKKGFDIRFDEEGFEITKKYPEDNECALFNKFVFFLRCYILDEKYSARIFSSFRDIMVLLKGREEDFLKGFYVDKNSLKEDIRELLDEYLDLNLVSSETKVEPAKQKSIFNWLKEHFNSN